MIFDVHGVIQGRYYAVCDSQLLYRAGHERTSQSGQIICEANIGKHLLNKTG